MRILNTVGSPVSGKDMFGRDKELAECWEHLKTDSMLLSAPRRVGKTSLLKALLDDIKKQGYHHGVYLTLEGKSDETDLLDTLFKDLVDQLPKRKAIPKRMAAKVGDVLNSKKKILSVEWESATPEELRRSKRQRVLETIQDPKRKWLLLVDELPLFLVKMIQNQGGETEQAKNLLEWLRSLRGPEFSHLRWVYCGSIGLDTVAERHRFTTAINDLRRYYLGPYDETTARRLLEALAASYDIPFAAEAATRLLERCGWLIPFHLQLLFDAIRKQRDAGAESVSAGQIEEAFDRLLGSHAGIHFTHWRDRLPQELGEVVGRQAMLLLERAARNEKGVRRALLGQALAGEIGEPGARDERLNYLLNVLERDGYLVEEGGQLRFRSPLLREFWLRHVTGKKAKQ